MNVRQAEPDDFGAIRDVARETWHDTYDELESAMIDRTVDEWYTDDTMPLEAPGTVVLVVERAEHGSAEGERAEHGSAEGERAEHGSAEIVGFTHAVAQGDTADILRMYVSPSVQGEGVGTDLHERLVEHLEVCDVDRIRAFDFAFNDASREFYEGLGFERTDTGEVVIDGDSYDEAVYTLER